MSFEFKARRAGVKMEMEGLRKLLDSFQTDLAVRVGIFGGKAGRKDASTKFNAKKQTRGTAKALSDLTNPELGAIHEFGSPTRNIPPRSFLRMPIVHQEEQIVKEIAPGADKLLANGEMNKLMARLGISAENAVQLAFATRGFNQWQPNFLATILRKKSSSPLIDTGQLRRSITSKVVNKHG